MVHSNPVHRVGRLGAVWVLSYRAGRFHVQPHNDVHAAVYTRRRLRWVHGLRPVLDSYNGEWEKLGGYVGKISVGLRINIEVLVEPILLDALS